MSVSLYGSGQTILQVQQTILSTAFTASTFGSYIAITGLSVSITPQSTTSKILVMASITGSDTNNYPLLFHIYKNGSVITPTGPTTSYTPNNCYAMLGGGTGSNAGFTGTIHFQYIDSPSSTSSLTYQIYVAKPSGTSNAIYINPVSLSGTSAAGGSSSITVLEISGS
jgi:hypothetical protein